MAGAGTAGASMVERGLTVPAMGGRLALRVAGPPADMDVEGRLAMVASRVVSWAGRLTRFDPGSELSRLNRAIDQGPRALDAGAPRQVAIGPTLAAVLDRARRLGVRTEGHVDVTLLRERLAAERPDALRPRPGRPGAGWSIEVGPHGGRTLVTDRSVGFDLDGVAKGWIADRARALLTDFPAAMVDADGDIAMHVPPWSDWSIAVADPGGTDAELARLRPAGGPVTRALGVATSGTSVHRWPTPGRDAHHIIDPRTGRAAVTDVIQATVVAEDATTAEALAKAAVIAGSQHGLDLLDRAGAWAAILVLEDGEVIASPRTMAWLA